MKRSAAVIAFLHSPEGSGLGAILLFATLLAGFAGCVLPRDAVVVCRKQDCGEGCCAPACRCLCQRILEFAQRAWRRLRAGPGHLPGSFDRTLQPGKGFRKHSSTAVGRPAGPRDCDAAPRSADGRYDRILRREVEPDADLAIFYGWW